MTTQRKGVDSRSTASAESNATPSPQIRHQGVKAALLPSNRCRAAPRRHSVASLLSRIATSNLSSPRRPQACVLGEIRHPIRAARRGRTLAQADRLPPRRQTVVWQTAEIEVPARTRTEASQAGSAGSRIPIVDKSLQLMCSSEPCGPRNNTRRRVMAPTIPAP